METITLYHGSKKGIVGDIRPESRIECDFGKGFYMGTKKARLFWLGGVSSINCSYNID